LKKILISIVAISIFALTSTIAFAQNQNWPELNGQLAKSLYEAKYLQNWPSRLPWDSNQVTVRQIEVGSFTQKGVIEALIIVDNWNRSHAAGYAECLLYRYETDWQIVGKMRFSADGITIETSDTYTSGSADGITVTTVDLNQRGIKQALIVMYGGNQGYMRYRYKLISLVGGTPVGLYETTGFNNSGSSAVGEQVAVLHEVSFRDVDGDGILEVIDTQIQLGRETPKSEMIKTDETVSAHHVVLSY